jgi:hypothetical protein
MRALSAHLRAPEDHARLPFHPDCPVCRSERLTGVLPSVGLVSLRTQAALAAGVLAFSAAAPSAVLAAETDQEQQGAAAPGQSGGADTTGNPDFDPGGASTDLPSEAPPVPQPKAPPAASNDDASPLDQEPANDVDAPVADAGDEPSGPNAQQPAAPATPPIPSSAGDPEQPASSTNPGPAADAPPATTAAPGSPRTNASLRLRAHERRADTKRAAKHEIARARQRARASAPDVSADATASAPRSAAGVQPVQATPTPSVAVAVGDRDAAARGDDTHVARPGESLWSIARDVLGGTASTAQIAREVNRLWELNKDRIGTGDRNLLMIGTRLTLR